MNKTEPLKKIKGFEEHGVRFVVRNLAQYQGVCPWCGNDKFFVNPSNGLWDCKTCVISGNLEGFLSRRMKFYEESLRGTPLLKIASHRAIRPQTFKAFNVGFNPATGEYMLPYDGNPKRTLRNIERYTALPDHKGNAYLTAGVSKWLGAPVKLPGTQIIYICEGFWDAMAWWEATNGKFDIYILAGAGNFPKEAAGQFQDKDVISLCDNDKAGRNGTHRNHGVLTGICKSFKWMKWPQDIGLKDGFDIRDLVKNPKNDSPINVSEAKAFVHTNLSDEPPPNSEGKVNEAVVKEEPLTGEGLKPEEVNRRYKEWLHITNTTVLDVIYGAAFANRINVDPLWLFLVAPPGGSKTELIMSLSDAAKMLTTTNVTPAGLVSGAHGQTDPSLIPKLDGKSLLIKDFTTILNLAPNQRDEIFGILRDAYDGKIEMRFGNGVHRNYKSRFGIIAGVTPVIEAYAGSSVLGERFIKFKIKQAGRVNVAREIIERAVMNLGSEDKMRDHLKSIGRDCLNREITKENYPKIGPKAARHLMLLAQFVASLRGVVSRDKYTSNVLFKPCSEIGTRLAKQFGALGMGISIYRMESELSPSTMRVLNEVGKDTAPDRVEEVVKQLYIHSKTKDGLEGDGEYFSSNQIGNWTRFPSGTISTILQDLELLYIVRRLTGRMGYYKLNPTVTRIIDEINLYEPELQFLTGLKTIGANHVVQQS